MLETRKVFIDTQYFVKSGLHFDNPAFKIFQTHCESSELEHITTNIVKRETKQKIRDSVNEALNAIQTFRRKAKLLAAIDDEQIRGLFSVISEELAYEKALIVFDDFFDKCHTKTTDINSINVEELMSLYFDKKPPFGDGKKKAEFPDAISLLSLKSSLSETDKIYVVSDDNDLISFCSTNEQFISVESLDRLLDIYSSHTNARYELVKRFCLDNTEQITSKITDYLEGCDVYNNSSWEDSEVDEGISVVNVDNHEPSIIYISDEESQITFDATVEFEVSVTGPDFNNGTYDREDGRIYTFSDTTRTECISQTFNVELYLSYDFQNGILEDAEITDIEIKGTSGGIEVSVEENSVDW